MDKTITAIGAVLIGLGVGFWVAHQIVLDLHSAYLTGGYLWVVLGALTVVLGLKKQDRLARKNTDVSAVHQKNAIGI